MTPEQAFQMCLDVANEHKLRPPANIKNIADQDTRNEIRSEERGEKIVAEEIARAIKRHMDMRVWDE